MIHPINTPRLILRRPFQSDADEFFDLVKDEETCRLAGYPHCAAMDQAFFMGFKMLWADLDNRLFVIVPGDGRMVGTIHVQPDEEAHTARLHLALHPDYRRLGYGSEILRALMTQLREAGFKVLSCAVAEDNAPALAFFHQLGFTPCGSDAQGKCLLTLRL